MLSVSMAGALPPWSRSQVSRPAMTCLQGCCRSWKSSQVQDGGLRLTRYLPPVLCEGTDQWPCSQTIRHRAASSKAFSSRISISHPSWTFVYISVDKRGAFVNDSVDRKC